MIYYILYKVKIQKNILKKPLMIPKQLSMSLLLDGSKLRDYFIYNLLLRPLQECLMKLIALAYLTSFFSLININKHIFR